MLIVNSNAVILSLKPPFVYVYFTTQQIISARTFKVFRKQSDIIEEIAEIDSQSNVNVYSAEDRSSQVFSRYTPCYYQVQVVETGETTDWFSWDTMYRVFEFDILDRNEQIFHYDMGSPLFLHTERTDLTNVRCPNCWDITKQMSMGNCSLCMDTGRQKPYLDPVAFYAEFGQTSRVLEYNLVEAEIGQKMITTSGLPKLKPGDIVHEPFKHELWLVENVNCIGRDTAPVLQQATVSLVQKPSIKYNYLVIEDSDMEDLLADMNEVNNERRF
jgi:hypothetical protein